MVGYIDRSELTFSFHDSEVTLQIAEESTVDGWDILPHQYPCKVNYNYYCTCVIFMFNGALSMLFTGLLYVLFITMLMSNSH